MSDAPTNGPPVALSEAVNPPPAPADPRAFLSHPGFRSWARGLRYERLCGQRARMLRPPPQ